MEGGMLVQILERPTDLFDLLSNKLDPEVREKSMSFCPRSADQAFGTEAEWSPDDLVPSGSISGAAATAGAHYKDYSRE
jgi:hypothetical protein